MNKDPIGICLWIANYEQITDDEIDTLGVAHCWKVVRDALEDPEEGVSVEASVRVSSVKIFFDLSETSMG